VLHEADADEIGERIALGRAARPRSWESPCSSSGAATRDGCEQWLSAMTDHERLSRRRDSLTRRVFAPQPSILAARTTITSGRLAAISSQDSPPSPEAQTLPLRAPK
jgi:hypothetical protein